MYYRNTKKAVAIITLLTFLFTNTSYGATESKSLFKNKKVNYENISTKNQDLLQKRQSVLKGDDAQRDTKKEEQRILSSHLQDLSQVHIPSEIGRVTEVYQASNEPDKANRLVVHIQDLHTNPEAEYNLAKILEILLNDYKMGLVCSEGAEGEVDTSSVSSFPDYSLREKI